MPAVRDRTVSAAGLDLQERVVEINRVAKVVKGGRRFSFTALVVVGDEREIVGISLWASRQSCEAWRASGAEARRREAMAGYVLAEQEAFYRGRELAVPAH